MKKNVIKLKLREGINEILAVDEAGSVRQKAAGQKKPNFTKKDTSNQSGKKDYSDVTRSFEKLGGPSMVDVMQLMGTPDDEKGVNRSLFRKKVKQIKNKDTGSYYQFDDEELNQVRAALDIKK